MDQSTEKLLQSPSISQQTLNSLSPPPPPTVNYDTHPTLYYYDETEATTPRATDQMVPQFVLGPYRSEGLYSIDENHPTEAAGYSSLPIELQVTPTAKLGDSIRFFDDIVLKQKPHAWEAEDAEEFITTLNEYGLSESQTPSLITISAEVHHSHHQQENYQRTHHSGMGKASKSRPTSLNSSQIMLCAGAPIEKYPKIMTSSCYGELNNPFLIKSDDEISLINKSTDNLIDSPLKTQCKSNATSCRGSNSLNNSIYNNTTDGFNSMSSSMYEPKSSVASSIDLVSGTSGELLDLPSGSISRNSFLDGDEKFGNLEIIAENDLQAIKKLLENETGGATCPCCQMPFDKGKKRKLIDTCGHEKCYTCVFTNEQCPLCQQQMANTEHDMMLQGSHHRITDYDTGIGSSSTIVSPIGSPYGQIRSQVKTNGHFTSYMQSRQELISPELHNQHHPHNTNNHHYDQHHHGIGLSSLASIQTGGTRGLQKSYINQSTLGLPTSMMVGGGATPQNAAHQLPPTNSASVICATPPQNRRRLFNPKSLRSPFGQRRSNTTNLDHQINSTLSGASSMTTSQNSDVVVKKRQRKVKSHEDKSTNRLSLHGTSLEYAGHLSSVVFGKIKSLWSAHSSTFNSGLNQLVGRNDEGGNVKPSVPLGQPTATSSVGPSSGKSKTSQDELQLRLGFFLENNNGRNRAGVMNVNGALRGQQSCSSLTSANTSPVSTLTGSSEADIRPQYNKHNNRGCDSISSLMSVSISGQSNDDNNSGSSPLSRRHSVTAAGQQIVSVNVEEQFKNRKTAIRRSARVGQVKGVLDPKIRFAQYRPAQLTLKPLFFEVPQQEPDPLFIGRHWLLREISNTLSATESSGILIHGNSGTGKTAILLQLVEYSCFGRRKELPSLDTDGIYCQVNVVHDRIRSLASHVVAYHFCQADNNVYCLVPDFIHSIAAQLCQAPQLAAYREYLLNEPHLQNLLSVKECIADPDRAMRYGILEPLAILRRTGKISGKNCIVLIDGLCEAEYHRPDHGDTIGTFLAKMNEYFPSWLKIIVTIRTQMLEHIKGLPYVKMSLDNLQQNEYLQKDLMDYITFRINHSANIQNCMSGGGTSSNASGGTTNKLMTNENTTGFFKFAQYLLNLTKGSFLYAKLVLDLVERGNLVIKSTSYKVIPVTLSQVLLLNFNLRFPTQQAFDKVSPILSVCLAALYPLTLNEIYYSINSLKFSGTRVSSYENEYDIENGNMDEVTPYISWNDFLSNFKLLNGFLIKRIDNTYMFFHPSFREWLIRRDEAENMKFLCDLKNGHSAIAFRLSRINLPLNAEQTLELGHHILKAHFYRNLMLNAQQLSSRDLQSYWIANVTDDISASLCTLRNVYSPNIKVSRLLLLSGASPNHITEFLGNAPILCIAANEGIVPMVSLLLEFGADIELSNSQGCTPLILSASKGHCDVVRQLVAAGSILGQVDTSQRCALVHAARSSRLSVIKYLLACDWNVRPNTNDVPFKDAVQQALIAASSQGCIEIIEDLLDMSEIDVNGTDTLLGETALTVASSSGRIDAVTVLLSRSALVDVKNRKDMSPLLLAVKEGHWAVAERLLQNHADLEQTDTTGKTALMIAAEEGHVGIIELLLNRGASLTICDRDGLTALSWACLRGRLQAAKCLLERNADKHHADNTGRTPLDLAAYQGSAGLVQMLIENGGKIEHVDINGMRPLDRAIACRNVQVVQVFLKRGAKLGPATWAMAAGKPEILLLLLNKLLEDGNILYRKSRIQEAAHRYQYALKKIPLNESLSSHNKTFIQLKFNFLLNYSRCRRKMSELSESIDLATQAIELKPENYDGYFARAKAYFEYGNLSEALNDVHQAIERSATIQPDIRNVLLRLKDDIKQKQMQKCESIADCIDTITDL